MAWTQDSANQSTETNDSLVNLANVTWDQSPEDWNDAEGTWDTPRAPWIKDSANSSVITNDTKL